MTNVINAILKRGAKVCNKIYKETAVEIIIKFFNKLTPIDMVKKDKNYVVS